jgi:hypothetical protein
MYELSFYVLCLIGTIYLFWRITMFFKTLLRLFWSSRKSTNKSTEDKTSELRHCNSTVSNDSE